MGKGREEGREEGQEEGRKEGLEAATEKIARAGILSVEQARAMLGLDDQGLKRPEKKRENRSR